MKTPFQKPILPSDVRELINFGMSEGPDAGQYESMATLQTDGVAALYNILCKLDFAYLADEVGMGKTYQALGLAALVWNQNPDARIVFLSPRVNLQNKWIRDFRNFVSQNYRIPLGKTGDRVLKCMIHDRPLISPIVCENLREFANSLYLPGRNTWFLRHTSFRRPLAVSVQTKADIRRLWSECSKRMKDCGLHDCTEPADGLTVEDASTWMNVQFGNALGGALRTVGNGRPAIDLMVVDEAQYLRHSGNQGNSVLRAALKGNVAKWLFLSATPIHSGRRDVQTQVNDYVSKGFVTDEDVNNHHSLVSRMKEFTIRRPRVFVVNNKEIVKHAYRKHVEDPAKATDMYSALSMALVQKKLVQVLAGRNNRFRIGFLSCFESLQDSLRGSLRKEKDNESESETGTDWCFTDGEVVTDDTREAPDEEFVSRMTARFEEMSGGEPMPHPKMNHTVAHIARRAFTENEKFLVFCRRLSAVEQLRLRLDNEYHKWIEDRVRQQWSRKLDWESGLSGATLLPDEQETLHERVDDDEILDGTTRFRKASAQGGWLYNYRLTFRDSGRNAMLFQENWLRTICKFSGVNYKELVSWIPDDLWREAVAAGTRVYRGTRTMYRQGCFRYLCRKIVADHPEQLGLTAIQSSRWREFLERLYPRESEKPDMSHARTLEKDWLLRDGFWETWQERFTDGPMVMGVTADTDLETLYKREIIKNWIWQSTRLTDTIIDLYCAEQAALQRNDENLSICTEFFNYLCGDSDYARVLRERLSGWFSHFRAVFTNAFKPENYQSDYGTMAAVGANYKELANPAAVVAITGGSNVNESAIRQFKTPSYPQIIVCTDVLKEGEDLHLFCDQVVHYGVAWTSGDLEQRIGRVDRFFSQIERRLQKSGNPETTKLNILYPYMHGTLEERQINLVRNRVKEAEKILDNFNVDEHMDKKEMRVDDSGEVKVRRLDPAAAEAPFADISIHLPACGNRIYDLDEQSSRKGHQQLRDIMQAISRCAGELSFIETDGRWDDFANNFTLKLTTRDGNQFDLSVEWRFMSTLQAYSLRFLERISRETYWENVARDEFSFAYETRPVGGEKTYYRTHRLFLHESRHAAEIANGFAQVVEYLHTGKLQIETDEQNLARIQNILTQTADLPKPLWSKPHKAELQFTFQKRKQSVNLYVYEHMILVVSRVTSLKNIDSVRFRAENLREDVLNWCLEENGKHAFGFLHLDTKGDLFFCERIFNDNLESADIQTLLHAIAFRADMYESLLTGADVN